MNRKRSALLFLILLSRAPLLAAGPGTKQIDAQKSVLTVRVYKTGLFSGLAHNHEIRAPIQAGSFDEGRQTAEFTVDARALRVLDPEASAKDRAEIQATMLGPKVLDSDKYLEIRFRSAAATSVGEGKWQLRGDLTLHGQTRPISVDVEGGAGHYHGSARLRQTDFGISPISIAGGTVKVKDEVRVEFDITGR